MSGPGFAPRLATRADRGIVVDLERAVYGDADVADPRYVEWLYERNPAGEGLVWWAATGGPGVGSAGQVAVVPMRVAVDGVAGTAGLLLNVVTHPDWRGRGVFGALLASAVAENERRGFAFTYGFPNPSSTPGFLGRGGFGDAGRVPLLVAPLDARALAATRAGPARVGLAAAAAALARLGAHRRRRATLPVEEVPPDWPGLDVLWPRLAPRRRVAVVHDRRFAAWRFGACPTRRYRVHAVRVGGEPAGVVVTRVAPLLGIRAGLIVDLALAPGPDAPAAGVALLARACDELAAGGAALAVALMLAHAPEYGALRRAGFVPCPRALEPQPFLVILRGHGARAGAVPARLRDGWFLSMADYDVA